ncbi:MAG: glycosyltransferase [Candidatus Hydrogenedentota bacterium]
MIPFAIVVLLLWGSAFLFLFRIPTCQDSPTQASFPALSVIVPARNEERNLPRLLASLAAQETRPHEIIVVDDGSTDRTAKVAQAQGAVVLQSKPLPEGWRGKTWSCAQGAAAATGNIFLFLDADTFFEKGGLRRILETYLDGHGALSIGPYHRVEKLYEELSAFFNVLMAAGTGAFAVGSRNRPVAGLFGPFLMIDRNSYKAIGGHDIVKDKTLENFHLAKHLRRHGIQTRCFGGRGSFCIRMYPEGLKDLVQGWSKAFASGAAESPRWIVLASVAWFSGAILAAGHLIWGAIAGGLAFWLGAGLYFLFVLQLWSILRRIGSFRFVTSLFYPVPLLFYQGVFARSMIFKALKKKVLWKGREIDS